MTSFVLAPGVAGICKADETLRLVIGWASTSTIDGEPVVDVQDEIVPASEIVRAAMDYMEGARPALLSHSGNPIGRVVFLFPFTNEITTSLNITCRIEGIIVGIRVTNDSVWQAIVAGTIRAFSVGGFSEYEVEAA